MNADIRDKWIAALESGKYKQATGALGIVDHFNGVQANCCLGVLCEIAIDSGLDLEKRYTTRGLGPDNTSSYIIYGNMDGVLPDKVVHWAGIMTDGDSGRDPFVEGMALSGYNDSGDFDFSDIADIIRDNVESA